MSQQSPLRRLRWPLLAAPALGALVLAGCSGGGEGGTGGETGGDGEATGFSIMVAQANDADDFYQQIIDKYSEETGAEIEVIPYPSDAYNTQVTTQLQAGNAADVMVLSPGTGQAISVVTLAESDFLEPLGDASTGLISENDLSLFQVDGETYGQPTALTPAGYVYNAAGAEAAGIEEYPKTYDDLLAACKLARDAGKSFTVMAGSAPPNTGLTAQLIAATRVYAGTPDWNQQRADGEVTFAEDEGWQDTLEDIVEMNEQGCFQDGVAGGTFDSITGGIGGQTAFTAAAPGSAASSIGDATGLDITVQAFPPADGQEAFTLASANYAYAINANSDDATKAAAQAFLDWSAEPENAKEYADLAGYVPITGATADDLSASYAPIGELLENDKFVGLPNASWPNPAVYDALGVGIQGLLTGQKTVDQVLGEMDAAWDS